MEKKKESTTSSPLAMCEKLFNTFKPAFRPLRRLTFRHQEPGGTTNPSATRPNHSLDSGTKDPSPQKELPTSVKPILPTSEKKPGESIAPKAQPHHPPPKPAATPPPPPPPPSASVPVGKVPGKVVVPSPAPPKAVTIPQPTAPKAAATPQPLPQPAPPAGAAAEAAAAERSKKNINERVEDYIKRAKARMRAGSGVGRPPTS